MAKAKRRGATRKKAAKGKKAKSARNKPARKKAVKRAASKKKSRKPAAKARSRKALKKTPKRAARPITPAIQDTIVDVIDEPAPGVIRVTEYEEITTTHPMPGGDTDSDTDED